MAGHMRKKQLTYGFIPPPAVLTSKAFSILFMYLCGFRLKPIYIFAIVPAV